MLVISMTDVENKIIATIEKIRPFLISEGGDIEFKEFKDGIVYVKMVGACSNCPMADVTLNDGIETALISEVPEVIKVVNIE